jgi:hypothetical protein
MGLFNAYQFLVLLAFPTKSKTQEAQDCLPAARSKFKSGRDGEFTKAYRLVCDLNEVQAYTWLNVYPINQS